MVDLLDKGRSKGRNIFLTGRANCGKSFLLRPLEKVFNALSNPAGNAFSFGDIAGKDVVLLDDYRYNGGKPIVWSDLLLLLDGGTVNFSLPRTHFAQDVCVPSENKIPVFMTGKALPVFFEGGAVDTVESEMLRVRFKVFVFGRSIPLSEVQECPPCACCFSNFMLTNAGKAASPQESQ